MLLTVFAKKRHTEDGKTFYNYLTTLQKLDGTELKCAVKFTDDAGNPKPETCPLNIEVNKTDCNLAKRTYEDENGNPHEAFTLWVTKWVKSSTVYEDRSMDDFI